MLRRRDLNPGDVFVYACKTSRHEMGTPRYVDGAPSWLEGAVCSPECGGPLKKEDLDRPVILLQKPEGRLEKRADIKAMLQSLAAESRSMAQELEDKASQL